jgi:hypothetical protein
MTWLRAAVLAGPARTFTGRGKAGGTEDLLAPEADR